MEIFPDYSTFAEELNSPAENSSIYEFFIYMINSAENFQFNIVLISKCIMTKGKDCTFFLTILQNLRKILNLILIEFS